MERRIQSTPWNLPFGKWEEATPPSGLARDGAARARSAFQSKEVRILTSEPVVVSEGCGQVPGLLPHHLEAPQVRTT